MAMPVVCPIYRQCGLGLKTADAANMVGDNTFSVVSEASKTNEPTEVIDKVRKQELTTKAVWKRSSEGLDCTQAEQIVEPATVQTLLGIHLV